MERELLKTVAHSAFDLVLSDTTRGAWSRRHARLVDDLFHMGFL